jgi:DNA-binding CsgD family transcriptional regulator
VWREKIERIELQDLTAEQSKTYMEKLGYTNRTAQQLTWATSYGHPLTLSLACSVLPSNDSEAWLHSTDYIGELAILWLKETTDASLRSVTQAASMLGTFNQEALSYITERDVDVDEFQRLISLSFVRRTSNGWTFHKLIRSIITKQLKDSSPTLYEKWTYRSAKYYADAIVRRSDHYNTAWALEQFFYHAGNALHRTIAHNPDGSNCRWEIANESDLEDAENFIRRSLEQSREGYFEGMDPRAGEPFRIVISKEESLYSLKDLDIRRIHSIAANAIVLLRSQNGEILGLTAIIPINADTLPYLEQDPYSKPYIESLSSEERALFERTGDPSPYFFMRRLSLLDITGRVTFSECVDLMYSLMSEGLLYVCAPPPTPFFASVSAAFGFVEVSVHDPAAPPVYALDLRGGRLEAYVEGMMSSLQPMNPQKTQTPSYAEPAAAPAAAPESAAIKSLSAREQDVVKLVLEGYSNAQIAKTLFISEATVKKHLYTIYNKLEVKNRAHLVKLTMIQG